MFYYVQISYFIISGEEVKADNDNVQAPPYIFTWTVQYVISANRHILLKKLLTKTLNAGYSSVLATDNVYATDRKQKQFNQEGNEVSETTRKLQDRRTQLREITVNT